MNIIVSTASGAAVFRPDTTLKRISDDFYVPDFVSRVSWSPVAFLQMSRAGKYIARRFAGRYYDMVNCGILLYPENLIDGSEVGFARACCLDHTSFLPSPLLPASSLEDGLQFEVARRAGAAPSAGCGPSVVDGNSPSDRSLTGRDGADIIFSGSFSGTASVDELIEDVSRFCYLRVGDLVAVELSAREPLCSREEGGCGVSAACNSVSILDFNVIF